MENLKYGYPLIFRTEFSVALLSDPSVNVTLKPLTYSTINASHILNYVKSQNSPVFRFDTIREVLKKAIVSSMNTVGFPNISTMVDQLPVQDVNHLYEALTSMSVSTLEQNAALDDMLSIQFSPVFQDESWQCKICQEKKLDYNRGCGFLPEDKRDPAPALPRVGGVRMSVCPISTIDSYVSSQASMVHHMFSAGVLPEPGGIGDQTEWFFKTALLYKRKINEAEREAIESRKNK